MALLEVKDLSIHFGGVKAVSDVSFSLEKGDFILFQDSISFYQSMYNEKQEGCLSC